MLALFLQFYLQLQNSTMPHSKHVDFIWFLLFPVDMKANMLKERTCEIDFVGVRTSDFRSWESLCISIIWHRLRRSADRTKKKPAFCAEMHFECLSCKKRSKGPINTMTTLTDSVCLICLLKPLAVTMTIMTSPTGTGVKSLCHCGSP